MACRKWEEDRAQAEKRQSEIDEEMVSIHERTEREGWTESLRGRFEALRRESKGLPLTLVLGNQHQLIQTTTRESS